MHSGEPDPIFPAPRRPRKGPGKLVRKWVVSRQAKHPFSKWVRITGTTVTNFTTCMTGEIYALLTADSTLSRLAIRADRPHWEAFTRGLAIAGSPTGRGGILNTAFSARTLVMTGELAPDQVEDYLSGLAAKTRCGGAAPPASTSTRSNHRTSPPPTRCWSPSAPATTTTCGCSTARI